MFNAAQTIVEGLCQDNWTDYPIVFGNAPFDEQAVYDIYYRATIIFGAGRNIGLGGLCVRYPSILDFAIFHRPGNGSATVLQIAGDIVRFFQNKSFGIYQFQTSIVREFTANERGLVQTLVSTNFHFDYRG